jgi:hypothetical protein
MMGVMRDRDVRALLLATLRDEHAGDPSTLIVEELGIHRGRRRIDVAVVNGVLGGYEIKSDADDLSRLTEQAAAYDDVLDEVTLVCAPRHLGAAERLIPRWWGLAVVDQSAAGGLRRERQPQQNLGRSAFALAELLWRDELIAVLRDHVDPEPLTKLRRRELLECASTHLSVDVLAIVVRKALQSRTTWRGARRLS